MDPYPKAHPPVRGGFAPFPNGWSSLGDCSDDNGCDVVTGGTTTTNFLTYVPTWVWLVGAIAVFGLTVLPESYRR